jgi:hypothetical protein
VQSDAAGKVVNQAWANSSGSEWSNMMKRLTGLDGVTLHGETAVMPTHVTGVLFCDPAARSELTAGAV